MLLLMMMMMVVVMVMMLRMIRRTMIQVTLTRVVKPTDDVRQARRWCSGRWHARRARESVDRGSFGVLKLQAGVVRSGADRLARRHWLIHAVFGRARVALLDVHSGSHLLYESEE